MLVYIVCYSLLALLAYQSLHCHSEKRQKKLATTAYLIVLLVVVLRRDDVGGDLSVYRDHFQWYSETPLPPIRYGPLQPGYITLVWLIGKVISNFNVFCAIWGFITITVVYKVISKTSDKVAVGLFAYVALNGLSRICSSIRGELARALVCLAAVYLNERKYKRAILLFALAVTIHATAIIGVLYVLVFFSKKHFKFSIVVLAVVFLLIDIFGIPLLVELYKSTTDYSNLIVRGQGIHLFELMLAILILIRYTVPFAGNRLDKLRLSFRVCIIGTTVQILAFGLSELTLLIHYFWNFFCILLPEALVRARGSNKYILMLGAFLFLTFWYVFHLWIDSSSIVPYHFFWE